MKLETVERVPITKAVAYSKRVPFNIACTIVEHTLTTDDELTPIKGPGDMPEMYPVPGYGALYRLIGDGSHSPTFNSAFKKSSSSGDYVNTADTLNLITFLYDGVDYWYSIIQPA